MSLPLRPDWRTLWEYAPPFQRLLMPLALNCAFGRAEAASLDLAELSLDAPHSRGREVGREGAGDWVFRVRTKSGVYGEWSLWPETAAALKWWLKQREVIPVPAGETAVLLTAKGTRFDARTKGNHANFQLPNAWMRLSQHVRKDVPGFRQLSFNKLRKTAGNLVREEVGGEVAGVFLCHGTPVRADALLDVYTNRPFGKVFAATDRVGERLRPLWAGVEAPFPDAPPAKGGANISQGTIRRIRAMRAQGYKVSHIAETLGVGAGTVRRWSAKVRDKAADAQA